MMFPIPLSVLTRAKRCAHDSTKTRSKRNKTASKKITSLNRIKAPFSSIAGHTPSRWWGRGRSPVAPAGLAHERCELLARLREGVAVARVQREGQREGLARRRALRPVGALGSESAAVLWKRLDCLVRSPRALCLVAKRCKPVQPVEHTVHAGGVDGAPELAGGTWKWTPR